MPAPRTDTTSLTRRGLRLEYVTIGWNAAEFFVTVGLGIASGSLALVAFGLDSVIELFASFVVVWHLQGAVASRAHDTVRALRLVGVAFAVLAVTLTVSATVVLTSGHQPDESPWGIAYLAVTAAVMLTLAILKRSTGRSLGSEILVSESTMTFLDAALATAILVALGLNSLAGWWWADGVATLGVAAIATREALENRREAAELSGAG